MVALYMTAVWIPCRSTTRRIQGTRCTMEPDWQALSNSRLTTQHLGNIREGVNRLAVAETTSR